MISRIALMTWILLPPGVLDDDVERGLLLSSIAASRHRHRPASHDDTAAGCGLDAVGLLHVIAKVNGFLEGEPCELDRRVC